MSKSNVLAFSSETNSGMTLRDYFAAKALIVIYTEYMTLDESFTNFYDISEDAYRLADAMMTARDKE